MDSFFEISSRQQDSPTAPVILLILRRFVWKIALATLLLMAVGCATRVMNAGLACPDWPLCYGQLIPTQQMNLQVFLEWFHRLDAALIGLSLIVLTGLAWWYRRQLPGWFPGICTGALALVVFQGVLGGLTVTELLRFDIVTAHLGTALLLWVILLVLGGLTLPYRSTGVMGSLAWVSLGAAVVVYLQSLSGALVGSQWAVHQCLSYQELCAVMNSHLIGVVPASAALMILLISIWRRKGLALVFKRLGIIIALVWILQIALGISTFYLRLQVQPLTVAHHTMAATLLGSLVLFTVLAFREQAATNPQVTPLAAAPLSP
jgi:cytochrome c oxidase assembly protein subunit 15